MIVYIKLTCLFLGDSLLGGVSESLDGVDVALSLFVSELSSFFLYFLDDSLPSESLGGDESLKFRSLDVGLAVFGGDFSLGGELGDHESDGLSFFGVALLLVVHFEETEFLEDVIGSLGAESLGLGVVGEAGDGVGADLGDFEIQYSDVGGDDATSD